MDPIAMRMIVAGIVILAGVGIIANSGNELGNLGSAIAAIAGIALIVSGTRQILGAREKPPE